MKIEKGLIFLLISFTSFLGVIILLRNNNLGNSFFRLFTDIPHYDKIGHFFLMGILAFLAVISLTPLLPYPRIKSTLIVLGIVLTIIAIEELSQIFVVTRNFSLLDFLYDSLGVATFGAIAHFLVDKAERGRTLK